MTDLPRRQGTYRLGVYGGMFDPPHLGHRAVVDAARDACALDRVLVVPAGAPPHRPPSRTPARARLSMAIRAFADLDHVAVSDAEVERAEHGEPGWMVDTLEDILAEPDELGFADLRVEAVLIVGADQLAAFTSWHRWRDILRMAELACVARPGLVPAAAFTAAAEQLAAAADGEVAGIHRVDMAPVDVSSTAVRAAASAGDRAAVAAMVPTAILDDVLASYTSQYDG